MTTYAVDLISNALREELGPGNREMMPEIDPVFRDINSTSIGVVRDAFGAPASGYTAGSGIYSVKHFFTTGLAGAFKWRDPSGDVVSALGQVQSQNGALTRAFPTATESILPAIFQRSITLNQGNGTIAFPMQLLQTEQLSAAMLKFVALSIKMNAKLIAQEQAVSFYKTNSFGALGTLGTVTPTGNTGVYTKLVVTLGTAAGSGRIRRFFPGQQVDILSAAGAVLSKKTWVVTAVDLLSRIVTLETIDGAAETGDASGVSAANIADATVLIAPHGACVAGAYYGPMGIEDWIIGSGTMPYGLSLTTHPQLKSLVVAVNGSLTETVLNKAVGAFDEAYGNMAKIDTFLTTGGVVREMLDQAADLGVFQRNGTTLNMQAGWADIGYSYNGKSYKWLLSTYCANGTLYGAKLADKNIKRYVPPRITGSGTKEGYDGEIQFFAPLGGSNGVFKHAHTSTGATSEYIEAPFFTYCELAPDQIQGMKLTGLTEQNQ